jgi:hypothetical protein
VSVTAESDLDIANITAVQLAQQTATLWISRCSNIHNTALWHHTHTQPKAVCARSPGWLLGQLRVLHHAFHAGHVVLHVRSLARPPLQRARQLQHMRQRQTQDGRLDLAEVKAKKQCSSSSTSSFSRRLGKQQSSRVCSSSCAAVHMRKQQTSWTRR